MTHGSSDLLLLDPGTGGPRPLRYVLDQGRWIVVGSSGAAAWIEQVLLVGGASVTCDGRTARCAATPVVDAAESLRLLKAFRTKYGSVEWLERLSRSARFLALAPAPTVEAPSPEERLRREFDAAAPTYHDRVTGHPIEAHLKVRTRDWLLRGFAGHDPLLEIGPGTGFETVPLLLADHRITAVDVSEPMTVRLHERARTAGVDSRLETRVGRLGQLSSVLNDLPEGWFAGAYSTFGAFNLEADIEGTRRGLGRCLRAGGHLLFTSLNRPGVVPMFWDAAARRWSAVRARSKARSLTTDQTFFPLDLYRRRPEEWARLLRPEFRLLSSFPVSVVLPPFNPSPRWRRVREDCRAVVKEADKWLSRRSALTGFGEWARLTFERTSEPSPA